MISSGCANSSCALAADARQSPIRTAKIVFTQHSLVREVTNATTFVAPDFASGATRSANATSVKGATRRKTPRPAGVYFLRPSAGRKAALSAPFAGSSRCSFDGGSFGLSGSGCRAATTPPRAAAERLARSALFARCLCAAGSGATRRSATSSTRKERKGSVLGIGN